MCSLNRFKRGSSSLIVNLASCPALQIPSSPPSRLAMKNHEALHRYTIPDTGQISSTGPLHHTLNMLPAQLIWRCRSSQAAQCTSQCYTCADQFIVECNAETHTRAPKPKEAPVDIWPAHVRATM